MFGPGRLSLANPSDLILFLCAVITDFTSVIPQIFSAIFYFIAGEGQYNTIDHPASQFIFREWFTDLENSMLLMIATGFTASLAFLLLFSAYRIASPPVVSPFEYSILIWSSLSGWFFFNEIPDLKTIIGIILIVCGGIYIFIREKAQDQSIATEKPLR